MKNLKHILIIAVCFSDLQAHAATTQSSMIASAAINPICSFSINDVAFGNFIPANNAGFTKSTLSISALCTKGTAPTVALNGGNAADPAHRKMVGTGSNTDVLNYRITNRSLYTSPIFGDGTNGTYAQTFDASTQNSWTYFFPVWLANNQFVTPDNYSDTITATINF